MLVILAMTSYTSSDSPNVRLQQHIPWAYYRVNKRVCVLGKSRHICVNRVLSKSLYITTENSVGRSAISACFRDLSYWLDSFSKLAELRSWRFGANSFAIFSENGTTILIWPQQTDCRFRKIMVIRSGFSWLSITRGGRAPCLWPIFFGKKETNPFLL